MSESGQNAGKVPVSAGEDRRIRKTKAALYQALVGQVLEKGYEAVTVQDLLNAADVGRSTFYTHFSGKEDLLRLGFAQLRDELAAATGGQGPGSAVAFSLPLLRHAQAHAPLYRAMMGERGATVAQFQIRALVSELVRQDLRGRSLPEALPLDLAVEALVGAFLTMLLFWLEKRPKLTPEAVDAAFREVVVGITG